MTNGNTLHQKWEISDEICPNSTRTMSPSCPCYCAMFRNAILHQKREILDEIHGGIDTDVYMLVLMIAVDVLVDVFMCWC